VSAASRARALIGVRFRPQGRSRDVGLDCVGLAALAFGVQAPARYTLRGGDAAAIGAMIDRTGLRRVDSVRPDDLLLCLAGPGQLHLLVRTDHGFVHADAGLRRVVEAPGMPRWPILGIWRRQEEA
jgi:lipoprotein Spr